MRTESVVPAWELDEYVAAFESAQAVGEEVDLANFLPPLGHPQYAKLLCELARIDLELSWRRGCPRKVEYYRDRFPGLADSDALSDLAFEEYRLRCQAGERPRPAEYNARLGITAAGWPEPPGYDTTVSEPHPAAGEPEPIASRYRFGNEIARGGMGIVYRARDLNLDREVAVKTVRTGQHDQATRRFIQEARITARLQHPGIPPVHDLGTLADGRPFLAMKLIAGRTLDELLRDRREPGPDLGRFVAVFEHVCQAVGYAHNEGVIHRDLKPSNVMVGAFGEVQVMDWGLAKSVRAPALDSAYEAAPDVHDRTGEKSGSTFHRGSRTEAGTVLGTPAYMAPEQARGESAQVDERADVFALGGILCAVLTGHPPYPGEDVNAIAAAAARADLTNALGRLASVPGEPELVDLCRRCLAVNPVDRPADAGIVAAEVATLRAAAEERAQRAEADRAAAEIREFERRKRLRTRRALAAALIAIAIGGGLAAWGYQRQADAHEDATRIEREEEERESEAAERVVREAVARAYSDTNDGRWGDARNSVARASDRLAGKPRPSLLWEIVDVAHSDVEMGSALETCRLTRAARRPGTTRYDHERAAAAYKDAFDRFGLPVLQLPPGEVAARLRASRIAPALVVALDDWAAWEPDAKAKTHLRAAARAAEDDSWRNRLRDLWSARDRAGLAALAQDTDTLKQPVASILLLALSIPESDRIPLLRAAHPLYPSDFWLNHDLGVALSHQGAKDAAEAIGFLRTAVALRPQTAGARVNLAVALYHAGDYEGSAAACRAGLRLDSGDNHLHHNLGAALREKGDLAGAEAAYREAIRLDPRSARAFASLGTVLRASDPVGAEAAYREALRLNPKESIAHFNLANLVWAAGRRDEALAEFREAARLDPQDRRFQLQLGNALRETGDLPGAEGAYREAIRLDPNDPESHTNLGAALRAKGDLVGAAASHRESIRLNPKSYIAHLNLGNVLAEAGDPDGAAEAYRTAIRIDPRPSKAHAFLANVLLDLGDPAGAAAGYREALRLGMTDPTAWVALSDALKLTGDLTGAVDALRTGPDHPVVRSAMTIAERRVAVSRRLSEFATGRAAPATPEDAVLAAEVSVLPPHRRYRLAHRLYADLLAARPGPPAVPTLYHAACAAVRLAAGHDPNARVTDDEWKRLHHQARAWLRQVAAALRIRAKSDPAASRELLVHWKRDRDLASVRDPLALAAMPEGERTEWELVWTEVDALVQDLAPRHTETAPAPRLIP